MKKILLAIALLSGLPIVASAEEPATTPDKAAPKEHHMQNADPSAAQEQVQAPEHTMQNSNPAPKSEPKQEKKHTIRNN